MTDVVAALIYRGERFLICRRPARKTRGGLWEFPGGKVEPGQTKQQALIREIREELGVDIAVGEAFPPVTHTYPDLRIRLTLFHAVIRSGVPRLLEHDELRWIRPEDIPEYVFCPADVPLLRRIRERGIPPEPGV